MNSVSRQDSDGLGDSCKHEGTLKKMGKATSHEQIGKAREITEPQAQCITEEQFYDPKQFHSKENVQPFINELYQDSSPKVVTRRQSQVDIPYNEHNNESENHFSGKKIDKSDRVFVTRFNIIIFYLSLIALAITVIKVQNIENMTNDLRRCRCEQVIGNKNMGPPSPFEDVPKDNSQDSNALFKYFNTEYANIKISPKLKKGEFIESSRNGASHIRTRRAVEGTPYEQNSSEEKSNRGTSDVTSVFTGSDIFETSEVNESRHIRIKRADKKGYMAHNRKKYCENVSKCLAKAKPKRLNVQSFEGNFYDIFPYRQHFADKVTSHPKWDQSIQAFPNNSIYFPAQYMELPFYKETDETVNKKMKEKLVYQDQNKPGVFTAQKNGTYLVHVNITMISDAKGIMPYLALFLNNHAVLVCPPGGFRCFTNNEEHMDKYRICNISGVLKLNGNDTLEIKTMVPKMEVPLKKNSKSSFIIALLK